MKKKVAFVSVIVLAMMFGGCATTGQVNSLTDNTKMFMSKVNEYQTVANKAFALAERDGAISKKTAAYVAKMSDDVNAFKPQLSEIVRAVDEAPDDVISKGKAGVAAAKGLIPPPFGELALAGLTIFELIRRKRDKDTSTALTKEAAKRRSEKAGVEKTIRELATMEKDTITADVVKSKLFVHIGDERARNGLT